MNPKILFDILEKNGIDFFTGVPDSTLKDFCFYLEDYLPKSNHIITANEGNAIGIASGHFLATGRIPLVYMQNSGFGNAINPLTSFADKSVFSIPLIIMMGWRGEPGKKDAIQHKKDGEIQINILESLDIPYTIISNESKLLEKEINEIVISATIENKPHIILVRRGFFQTYTKTSNSVIYASEISREDAILEIIKLLDKEDILISTTGKVSRELFELRKSLNHNTENDLRVIGSMGHVSSIALGISLRIPNRQVYCLDGDGSLIMHMGVLSTIGKYSNDNFKHILLNNYSHDSVGGQESSSDVIDYSLLSKSMSYKNFFQISFKKKFAKTFKIFKNSEGPSFLEIIVSQGSRANLSRPNSTPLDNKRQFMHFLNE